MRSFFLLLLLLFSVSSFTQTPIDTDNDGLPDNEDLCPSIAGIKQNKGCPSQTIELTEADKKLFIKNFQTILQHIPTGYAKIKSGEEDIDVGQRISWYKSTLQLFPNFSDKNMNRIMFGNYSGKPVIGFTETIKLDVNTLVEIIMPVLKAKGMIEVNSLYTSTPKEGRSFRSKDAVLQITYDTVRQLSQMLIGKLPAYYEAGIKPLSGKLVAKPPVTVQKPAVVTNNKPTYSANIFIDKMIFEDILNAVCKNTFSTRLKNKVIPENNQWYETNFKTVKPLYYSRVSDKQFNLNTTISTDKNDLQAAVTYINNHMQQTVACLKAYRAIKLTKDEGKQSYSDVYAWDGGGLFVVVAEKSGEIQFNLNKITYKEKEPATAAVAQSLCIDFEKILSECIAGYQQHKGTFVKKEVPAIYYTTTLPGLGFDKKYIVDSKNINIENGVIGKAKDIVYYNAEQDFTNSDDAMKLYEKVKTTMRNCFSGTTNSTDDKNQKIFEVFTSYKGYTIRIALIYLNFFSSNVSISIKLAE
jgi:hypothetical protein